MELISIAMGAAMIFGLLTADVVVSAETVIVQISVPASVAQTGYSEDVAEQIFTHEFVTINQTRSLLRPPVIRPARQPTIVGVIAGSTGSPGAGANAHRRRHRYRRDRRGAAPSHQLFLRLFRRFLARP